MLRPNSRSDSIRLSSIVVGSFLVILLGFQPRVAPAAPLFSPDTIGIDGQVSFRVAPGLPVVSIPFFFLESGQTFLQIDEILPLASPPGFGFYRLFSQLATAVIGASLILRGRFDAECLLPIGCGPLGLNFEVNGIVAVDADSPLRILLINFDDLLFEGGSPLSAALSGEVGVGPLAGNETTLKTQQSIVLNPGVAFASSTSKEVGALIGEAALRARIGIETSGNINQGEKLSSSNTFEIQLITGQAQTPTPAPEPAMLALLGIGLVGLGFSRCRRKKSLLESNQPACSAR